MTSPTEVIVANVTISAYNGVPWLTLLFGGSFKHRNEVNFFGRRWGLDVTSSHMKLAADGTSVIWPPGRVIPLLQPIRPEDQCMMPSLRTMLIQLTAGNLQGANEDELGRGLRVALSRLCCEWIVTPSQIKEAVHPFMARQVPDATLHAL